MTHLSLSAMPRADAEPLTLTLTDDERQPCEIWTRVMGYHRPVSSFNRGKKAEFLERRCYQEAHMKELLGGE
ncbi:anaerobic ribonucleoside-triphosphate reductase [Pararhodospirillum oryzae]|uniref:Uncharacterized protein n=1 Tax=Pararhodospirillum oryzae TaxID=478448 RepID=A0A512H936_9PROT|nr:anaerobic ribonucleoside-triphosphate reductase [Pararhodospirillum oryzae]GEO81965.1 hypothetical protein ROR02_20960 [Pararhodospirillum oryzae]